MYLYQIGQKGAFARRLSIARTWVCRRHEGSEGFFRETTLGLGLILALSTLR